MTNLVARLGTNARANPAAVALAWNKARWTYADLARATAAARDALRAHGLQRGDRVALLLRNSPQYVAALFGTFAAGGAAVALNALERAEVLTRQIAHSGATVVIVDPAHVEYAQLCEQLRDRPVKVVALATPDSPEALEKLIADLGEAPATADADCALEELALLIYTSGTTGRPKAVMLCHGNLASNAHAIVEYLALTPADRGFCVLPFHFSYGNSVLTSHLLAGAELVIEDNLAYPLRSLQRMVELRVTGFAGVPSTFTLLLTRACLRDYDLAALRYVTQAGGAMMRASIERLRAELPHTRIFVMYGQTEATARISWLPSEELDIRVGSVGRPIANTEIGIFDLEGLPLATGMIGEIRVRGPGIMLGYWQDPEASREAVRDGWLCTGDLGHQDAHGFLYIDGRAVEMIKVGAFRVSPYEVEEAIAQLEDVVEVAVGATPDDVLGQAVKAVIVLRQGAALDALAVKAHCRHALAQYKIPKIVEFATELPRTQTGKVQRLQLT
jgi:acyl-CoA synthetase (AMP-forming)/AMP-acid ligase II